MFPRRNILLSVLPRVSAAAVFSLPRIESDSGITRDLLLETEWVIVASRPICRPPHTRRSEVRRVFVKFCK
jgi:hypothetical protein